MKTYLAKTDAEARGLHDGTVTEIVIKMRWPFYESRLRVDTSDPCPYAPGDEIAVKNPRWDKRCVFCHLLCLSTEPREIDGQWVWVCGVKFIETTSSASPAPKIQKSTPQ